MSYLQGKCIRQVDQRKIVVFQRADQAQLIANSRNIADMALTEIWS